MDGKARDEAFTETRSTESRLVALTMEIKRGMDVAKKMFDELQAKEQKRLDEKTLSLRMIQTKLKILDHLIHKKKLPEEVLKALEG